jgi:hypothetical protein
MFSSVPELYSAYEEAHNILHQDPPPSIDTIDKKLRFAYKFYNSVEKRISKPKRVADSAKSTRRLFKGLRWG